MTKTSSETSLPHDEPHEASERAGWSVRRYLVLFTVALIVPILALLGFVLYRFADNERTRLEREAGEFAQSIAMAIDRDVTGLFSAIDVLSTSAYLAARDFEGVHTQAARILEDQGITTLLLDRDGQQLVNAGIPWGEALPRIQLELDPAALDKGRPFVSDMRAGQDSEPRHFLVARGVRSGRQRYVLTFSIPIERLQGLLRELRIPEHYTATILDRASRVAARSRSPERFVGEAAPEALARALGSERGSWDGATLEGTPVFTAFQRSLLSGYTGIVGINYADLNAPVLRSMSLFGVVGTVIAALSTWLAFFVGRRITRPIATLARTAAALGRGERIEPLASRLVEANQVGKVLVGASANLREREDDLREANEELQRFAYIVSHDLRSPLVNIMGFTTELEALRGDLFARLNELKGEAEESASSAKDAELGQDFDEAIGFIKASISKMDRLINAILQLSRAGRREFSPERIDMDALLQGIKSSLTIQAESAEATVTIRPLPSIVSDRVAIEQIFSNLVDNALKYLRKNVPGRIEIIGKARGSTLVYEVRDNGRGIEEKDLERVFDLFRRSGVQDRPGEGIGLAHVRALVRRVGGTISLTSTPGTGSTFTVTLPRRWAAQDQRRAP